MIYKFSTEAVTAETEYTIYQTSINSELWHLEYYFFIHYINIFQSQVTAVRDAKSPFACYFSTGWELP